MTTLGDQVRYEDKWNPEGINLQPMVDILKEVVQRHDVQDAGVADSLAKRLLIVADDLLDHITKIKIYYEKTRSAAKDHLNDVALAANAKSDAAATRIGEADSKYREMRNEYRKAELLFTHLEGKHRELISFHYLFRDTARRLSGMAFTGNSGSDSDRRDDETFGQPQLPLIDGAPDQTTGMKPF